MFHNVIISLLVLAIVLPIGAFFIGERKSKRFKNSLVVNLISFFGILLFTTVFILTGNVSAAETTSAVSADGLKYIGAALAVGLSCIGAGTAVGSAASAALGALSENEGIMGKALIFVALAEGVAIYGLIIAFMILGG